MKYKIIIDGTHFSNIDEFYDEMDILTSDEICHVLLDSVARESGCLVSFSDRQYKLLTKNHTWRTGHNMDAFHDLLRGGFGIHEVGEGIEFYWVHADKSRQDFGYEAAVLYWEKFFRNVILLTTHSIGCFAETY